ncbi:tRNA methyl transferase PRC-barrel domain-containing protein [Yinghuangia aomiensis]
MPKPSAAAWPSPASRTATTSASSRTATPRAFLATRARPHAGDIVDQGRRRSWASTRVRYAYTVGQRKGLRIGRPADDGKPRYVLDISPVTNTVTVGPGRGARRRRPHRIRPRWCGPAPTGVLGLHRAGPRARRRAPRRSRRSTATPFASGFTDPMRGVAPGQAVVLYDGTRVIGSATIDGTSSAAWRFSPCLRGQFAREPRPRRGRRSARAVRQVPRACGRCLYTPPTCPVDMTIT